MIWDEAETRCQAIGDGYDLVVINDEEENKFLTEHKNAKHTGNEYWIGLIRISSSSVDPNAKFSWVDGSNVNFKNWRDGEPNNVR